MSEVNHVILYDSTISYNMQNNQDVQLFFLCLAIMTFLFVLLCGQMKDGVFLKRLSNFLNNLKETNVNESPNPNTHF